jgi:hypothetical protein
MGSGSGAYGWPNAEGLSTRAGQRAAAVPGDGRRSPADELLRAVVAQIDRHRRELNADPGLRQVRLTVRFREGRIRYAQVERASESDLDGEYED